MRENTAKQGVSVIKWRELEAANFQPPNSTQHSRCIMELTQSYLKTILHYDPETGKLIWDAKNSSDTNKVRLTGREAGTLSHGYRVIHIRRRSYHAHRLVWLYVYGKWPAHQIDHINGVRDDNRLTNLREVTNRENSWNAARKNTNTSGVVGVSWDKRCGRWQANITVRGKMISLGRFHVFDDAVAARKAAERKHGFHENHGCRASTYVKAGRKSRATGV